MRQGMHVFFGCAVAMTMACGDRGAERGAESRRDDAPTSSAAAKAEAAETITLTGCLQQGGGALRPGYLLTTLGEPSGSVATSGSVTQSGSSVEREQLRMAASTFRLDPKGDIELDTMLGKQVRVTGVITDEADLPNGSGGIGSDADTQRPNSRGNRESVKVDARDLAKVEVTSVTIVGESCSSDSRESGKGK